MDRTSLLFCMATLVVSLLVAVFAFPYAALDGGTITAAQAAQPAYDLGSVDVGQGFGKVSVEELMTYYMENPPAQASAGAGVAPKIKFGGC